MQRVTYVARDAVWHSIDDPETYQLRKDRPLLWLQKACLFVLRKLRAFSITRSVTYRTRSIDAVSFMNRLLLTQQHLHASLYRRGGTLLIGADDYNTLMSELGDWGLEATSFRAEYRTHRTVYGLQVHIIPWMSGMVLLPENMKVSTA